ncbi:MAG: hypothetical protein HRT57_04170 [Crocinitomicaceae bacterium]|nr:hypothetical protein [Crocinitomicaceae bacterium]
MDVKKDASRAHEAFAEFDSDNVTTYVDGDQIVIEATEFQITHHHTGLLAIRYTRLQQLLQQL